VFVISGAFDENSNEAKTEADIQSAFDAIAARAPDDGAVINAKRRVREALTFDIETTEDAAHQLAYFAGIDALDALLELENAIDAVSGADLQRIAATYLRADLRTIAWARPGDSSAPAPGAINAGVSARSGAKAPAATPTPPALTREGDEFSIAVHPISASPTIAASAIFPGLYQCPSCAPQSPAPGFTTISAVGLRTDQADVIDRLRADVATMAPMTPTQSQSSDPLTRLEEVFASYITATPADTAAPYLIAVSGDFDATDFPREIKAQLSGIAAPQAAVIEINEAKDDIDVVINEPKAQVAIGYAVKAPGAADPAYPAWRIALYILSHGYEGRLGKETISRRGLVYYIDAAYRAAPDAALITIAAGVDPDKLDAMKDAMTSELARLLSTPPTPQEIAEAKRHFIGRKISAAQSNSEIVADMALDWAQTGELQSAADLDAALAAVTRDDVLAILPAFVDGAVITIDAATE
jgi:predicted Zn-dependent peptidase